MKVLLYILLVFISFEALAQQTYSINGTVNDEKGQPIPGATVFLTNTKNATATDGNGKFILDDITPGPYEVVIKMLGFTPDIQTIKVENKPITIAIKLKEANINLSTVTVKGKPDRNRKTYLEWFTKNFIGQSTNAGQCKLLNPDVLIFYYNAKQDIINAYANDFIIIENNALGYRIKYLLKKFESHEEYGACYYEGNPYFEELKGDEAQQKQWEVNRRVAYLGSSRHFFRAVIGNTAAAEGFALYSKDAALKNFDDVFVNYNDTKAIVSKLPYHWAGENTPREQYYVVYKPVGQSALFYKTGFPVKLAVKNAGLYQISKIVTFSDTIKIDKELLLNPTINFSFSGYWAWERIAEYLPLDYFVDPLAEEKK